MEPIEIVAIGDEVLSGAILNSNAAFISRKLFEKGYIPSRHTVLPDQADPLLTGFQEALQRAPCVICTGGLGPTCDDNTRQAAARLFASDWRFDQETADSLRKRYGEKLISLNDQATVPSKAYVIPNAVGTAPGLVFQRENGALILLPGVPSEMEEMFIQKILPFLEKKFPLKVRTVRKRINFFDVAESVIDPLLRQIEQAYPSLKIGIYASEGILQVWLSANQAEQPDLDAAYAMIWDKYKEHIFEADTGKIEEALQTSFIHAGWTLSAAESCTGGSICANLTKLPGASRYFLGGAVAYSNELKHKLLGVSAEDLERFGAVSLPVVEQMARGVLRITGSDFSVAVSGIAGPDGGTEKKPVGTICAAICSKGGRSHVWQFRLYGNRQMIIAKTVHVVLGQLYKFAAKGCN